MKTKTKPTCPRCGKRIGPVTLRDYGTCDACADAQPAQHTPGPWIAANADLSFGTVVMLPMRDPQRGFVHVADCNVGLAEHRANARLIAAAPEMLAVLGYMQDFLRIADQTPSVVYALTKVDAMIAKATGGAL